MENRNSVSFRVTEPGRQPLVFRGRVHVNDLNYTGPEEEIIDAHTILIN